MFDKIQKGMEMKKVVEDYQETNRLDIRKIEDFLQKPFRNCGDCDLENDSFCSEHDGELKDFSLIADWLNTQLKQKERLLESAGVDFEPVGKFDMETIRDIFEKKQWNVALHQLNTAFDKQNRKLLVLIGEEMGVDNPDEVV